MNKPNIIKLKEQGFCYGVKRALKIVQNAVYDPSIPKPIYLLGNVVHNQHIHNYLKCYKISHQDLLEQQRYHSYDL